jgi:signal transduction histidine kinase
MTGMGFAAVARVTDKRWIACAVRDEIDFGLKPGGELKVETTICDEIRETGEPVVIDNVAEDAVYCGHPTPAMYAFKSYISMPVFRSDGSFFGTLCAIGSKPARLNTPETIGMFRLFADLIAQHLDTQERLAVSEAALLDAQQTAALREEFIAVLGHDLRNPLSSINGGAAVLRRLELGPQGSAMLDVIQKSVRRMAALIDDVLDFARARLGGGLSLGYSSQTLSATLEHVVGELRAANPERVIESHIDVPDPVYCDSARIAQLLSNLMANALSHGAPDGPITVDASVKDRVFEVSVSNTGEPIATAKMERLFQPFTRAAAAPDQKGLGLGLYIAAEIARAHAGALSAYSNAQKTTFTFRMPADPCAAA